MSRKESIRQLLLEILVELGQDGIKPEVEHPISVNRGDYTTNIAMVLAKKLAKNPFEVAEEIRASKKWETVNGKWLDHIEVVKPGFINFWLSTDDLMSSLGSDLTKRGFSSRLSGKRIMVEYAHPNTHKEMHIGHMRTLITGEALSRIFEAVGAKVFRANYQGDIGPHVAKAMYGTKKLLEAGNLDISAVNTWSNKDKAHLLGRGYVEGNIDYEAAKEEIDSLNTKLYQQDISIMPFYQTTRQWSLDYYEDFYKRFYTKFDQLFFESQMFQSGKKIVEDYLGSVFKKENGAIIFPGEEYGLHTRVFITQAGNPTYEGKEMGNGFAEYQAFPFDFKMHIVASEQAGYFQVVFKALELIDPGKFAAKQHHLSMGMVTLTDRKMSSRTGDILTVDWLIDQVKARVEGLVKEGKIDSKKTDPDTRVADETVEMIAIGAIKYSVLKGGTGQNVAFDIEKSVSLEGNSGSYLQYTYARTCSVLAKSKFSPRTSSDARRGEASKSQKSKVDLTLEIEERQLLRKLYLFEDVIVAAAEQYAPNYLATFLFDLSQLFNLFYQKHKIIGSEKEEFRLELTQLVGNTLLSGLDLLGIQAPKQM